MIVGAVKDKAMRSILYTVYKIMFLKFSQTEIWVYFVINIWSNPYPQRIQ